MGKICWLLLVLISRVYATDIPLQAQSTAIQPLSVKQQAGRWGVTQEEWLHYLQLKQGERGIWSPNLDPLTTLGVEAQSDEERRRFAELLVQKDYHRVVQELAFQRAYDAAWKRLYPDLLPVKTTTDNLTPQHLALFVRADCPACDNKLRELLAARHPLDIYLVGSNGDDSLVTRWAQGHGIDARQVQLRNITLNHDGGRWHKYGQNQLPVVLQQLGGKWQIVSL